MSLLSKLANPGQDIWYSPGFRSVLEDHMTYLRNHPDSTVQPIEPNAVIKYRFDLFSLFALYGIEYKYHWLVMRVNHFNNPQDDISELQSFMVPNPTVVMQILAHHTSRSRTRGK